MFTLIAQKITNPVLNPKLGANQNGGQAVAITMANLFRALVMIGGLALLLYMAWGGINWITAGGDKGKVEEAKNKITGAAIGMAILVAVIAVASFLSDVFGYDLLNPTIPTVGN